MYNISTLPRPITHYHLLYFEHDPRTLTQMVQSPNACNMLKTVNLTPSLPKVEDQKIPYPHDSLN